MRVVEKHYVRKPWIQPFEYYTSYRYTSTARLWITAKTLRDPLTTMDIHLLFHLQSRS
jgi:hypothetical protein